MISSLLVTYLPTILMNMINQASNYITGSTRFDLVYTINITCMMVLASVYLSVSASLPTTSDIKPVEIWLLFNLAYPFLVILVNVVLQVSIINIMVINLESNIFRPYKNKRRRKTKVNIQKCNIIDIALVSHKIYPFICICTNVPLHIPLVRWILAKVGPRSND